MISGNSGDETLTEFCFLCFFVSQLKNEQRLILCTCCISSGSAEAKTITTQFQNVLEGICC